MHSWTRLSGDVPVQATHYDHGVMLPSWPNNASTHVFGDGNALKEAYLLQVDTCLAHHNDDRSISIHYEASF